METTCCSFLCSTLAPFPPGSKQLRLAMIPHYPKRMYLVKELKSTILPFLGKSCFPFYSKLFNSSCSEMSASLTASKMWAFHFLFQYFLGLIFLFRRCRAIGQKVNDLASGGPKILEDLMHNALSLVSNYIHH